MTTLGPNPTADALPPPRTPESYFHFQPLVLSEHRARRALEPGSVVGSAFAHVVLASALILVPLFVEERLPTPDSAVRAFFAEPAELAPPPPPPPPPPAPARRERRAAVTPRPAPRPDAPAAFVAPISVPEQIPVEEGLDLELGGDGVEGGVAGGVPGGVVGGIIGGLPDAPPVAPKLVRVGGAIQPPALLKRVAPVYPDLARQARLEGIVVLEAHVGGDGHVREVKVLRGVPLLAEAAIAAVRAWRYKPLLLNGIPTEFLLSVSVSFGLETGAPSR